MIDHTVIPLAEGDGSHTLPTLKSLWEIDQDSPTRKLEGAFHPRQ